jgi:hypothetical protein
MNQRQAWEALSAAFERAKEEYFQALNEAIPGKPLPEDSKLEYLTGKFDGLLIARDLLAPYLQPK